MTRISVHPAAEAAAEALAMQTASAYQEIQGALAALRASPFVDEPVCADAARNYEQSTETFTKVTGGFFDELRRSSDAAVGAVRSVLDADALSVKPFAEADRAITRVNISS
ncbi:hypothetical protein [Plantactinospora sonchi]|uniref:PE domain-containing protein n=1 Tax=Plantactinospora sonchi TaxID=1544735 RepID=A0ABU7RR12_9ACTN